MKRQCLFRGCVVLSVLILLLVNIFIYYMVETGFKVFNFEQITAASIEVVARNDMSEKKIPSKAGRSGKDLVVKQRFIPHHSYAVLTASVNAAAKLTALSKNLPEKYHHTSTAYMSMLLSVLKELRFDQNVKKSNLSIADQLISASYILPPSTLKLGSLLNSICSSKIVKADNSKKGTQLKLLLTLEGGYKALYKPQWYDRNTVITGPVYAGKDRHNAEVAAFHLSLLLGLRRVPLTVGRRIDLRREVIPVASQSLRETFFQEGNNTCFYGVCFYCTPTDPVCAKRDLIEGALILWLPQKLSFTRYIHPWQRSYRSSYVARWEVDEDYCIDVKKTKLYSSHSNERLLDLIETSIFDFLIGNGDRHHYEVPKNTLSSTIFLFDNGKSFGNPYKDFIDILAPLYQCCIVRRSTWETLINFRGGVLGKSLEKTLDMSHIAPVLASQHYQALDRRLMIVFAAVEICLHDNYNATVFM